MVSLTNNRSKQLRLERLRNTYNNIVELQKKQESPVSVLNFRVGKPRVLFLNHNKWKCGVYQFGVRVYNLAARSKKINYFYKEVDNHEEYINVINEIKPNYIIYNWHWDRMPWLKDIDITSNRAMMHYFIYHDGSMMRVYDKYLFFGDFDPKGKDAANNRSLLPRPLFAYSGEYPVNKIPTIGSFGFAFKHKKFPELVALVNNQFDEAVINIHMTLPYFGDSPGSRIVDIANMCHKNNKKKGIKLNITQDFWDDQQLLAFLAGNDINVFAYENFNNPGVSSAIDYALSVKRPIGITSNMMFRHIASKDILLEKNSIRNIMNEGTSHLQQYYDKWSLDNFTSSMENLFVLPGYNIKQEVLFVNHKIANCGVYQFGKRLYEQIATSNKVHYTYKEVDSKKELEAIFKNPPENIIFNWHRATMPLLTEEMIVNNKESKHYFLFHEEFIRKNYDKYLFFGDYDIGNNKIPLDKSILLPRPLFDYLGVYPKNEVFTIGSFGFGFWNKGFHELVKRVNEEFKEATINLHMAYSHFGDPGKHQTNAVIAKCRELNTNNIKLNIIQTFLSNEGILAFLAGNDINIFLYSENGEGISSATDYALSVKRPIMVSDCQMFRHFKNDEIIAEKNSIMDVYNRGLKPLEKVRENWITNKLIEKMDEVFSE